MKSLASTVLPQWHCTIGYSLPPEFKRSTENAGKENAGHEVESG